MSRNSPRDDWRHDIREANAVARSTSWRVAIWVIAVVAFVGLISGGIWAFRVVTSDVQGAGDATRQINSAGNRLNAQNKFNELYEGVTAADDNINTLAATASSDMDQTNLKGAMLVCRTNVADYNQMVSNQLTGKWLPAGLPTRLGLDAETDCQPDNTTPTPSTS